MELDLNRGVTMTKHPEGFYVAMYKDAPGVFLDIEGAELKLEIAEQAGFDVVEATRLRRINEKRGEAEVRIRAEVEQEMSEALGSDPGRAAGHKSYDLPKPKTAGEVQVTRHSARATKHPDEPRETTICEMKMVGIRSDDRWDVHNKQTGKKVASSIPREEAIKVLLATKE